jgi:hypothetical protein
VLHHFCIKKKAKIKKSKKENKKKIKKIYIINFKGYY